MAFREHLLTRTHEHFAGYDEQTQKDIYDFVNEVALESFKNGLATARRKSAPRKRGAGQAEELVIERV